MPRKHYRDFTQRTKDRIEAETRQRAAQFYKDIEETREKEKQELGLTEEEYTNMKAAELQKMFEEDGLV